MAGPDRAKREGLFAQWSCPALCAHGCIRSAPGVDSSLEDGSLHPCAGPDAEIYPWQRDPAKRLGRRGGGTGDGHAHAEPRKKTSKERMDDYDDPNSSAIAQASFHTSWYEDQEPER